MSSSGPVTSSAVVDDPRRNVVVRRLGAVMLSHTAVDVYSFFVPPLIGVLQVRCELTDNQAAWMLGIGSLSSGLSQPLGAWISDHTDTRILGALGLILGATCLTSIGLADSFWTLLPLFVLGMIGVGIYHPIGASMAGELFERLPGDRRTLGVSIFFVFGMAGGMTGAMIARLVADNGQVGFDWLRWAIFPGLLLAVVLHLAIRRVPHRHHEHHLIEFTKDELTARWGMVVVLFISNAMRFAVNMALIYLLVRWAESLAFTADPTLTREQVAEAGGRTAGTLNACMVLGMAIGGLVAGTMIPRGREKWPMVIVPILFAPALALFGYAGLNAGYFLAFLSGIGFAAMIPITLSLAQRLLPHRTSLASGLMLGAAWAVAAFGPRAAEFCLGTLKISMANTFVLTGGLLVLTGLVCIPLSTRVLNPDPGPASD